MPATEKNPTALIVDWGGVLTNGLDHMLTNWTGQENIDLEVQNPIEQVKEDIENITGPVKRQL